MTASTYFDAIAARGGIVERITKEEIPRMANPTFLAISGRLFTTNDEWIVVMSAHLDEPTACRIAAWVLGHHEETEKVAILFREGHDPEAFGCDDIAGCRARGIELVGGAA
jgi:hypothetical protein